MPHPIYASTVVKGFVFLCVQHVHAIKFDKVVKDQNAAGPVVDDLV